MGSPALLKKRLPSCSDFSPGSPRSPYPSPGPPTLLSAGLGPVLASQRPPGTVAGTQGPARSKAQNQSPPTMWLARARGRDRRLRVWASPASAGRSEAQVLDPGSRPGAAASAASSSQRRKASSRRAPPPRAPSRPTRRDPQGPGQRVPDGPAPRGRHLLQPPDWAAREEGGPSRSDSALRSPAGADPCLLPPLLPPGACFSSFHVSAPREGFPDFLGPLYGEVIG